MDECRGASMSGGWMSDCCLSGGWMSWNQPLGQMLGLCSVCTVRSEGDLCENTQHYNDALILFQGGAWHVNELSNDNVVKVTTLCTSSKFQYLQNICIEKRFKSLL